MSPRPYGPSDAVRGASARPRGRTTRLVALCAVAVALVASAATVATGSGDEQDAEQDAVAGYAVDGGTDTVTARADLARAGLAAVAAAWRDHDRAGFVAAAADSAQGRRWAAQTWSALVALRVGGLDLRYAAPAAPPRSSADGSVVADVTWTQTGWAAPARTQLIVDVADDGGLQATRARSGSPPPAWALGAVRMKVGRGFQVVLPGGGAARRAPGHLPAMVATARAQVDAVLGRATRATTGPLVVVAPASRAVFSRMLGRPAGDYAGIAAVTTTVDGSVRDDAPAQVVLNPAVFASLSVVAAQVVLTHEATHAATGAAAVSMPLWVAEGFADYVALHGRSVPLRLSAGQALSAVRDSGPPRVLPRTSDFAVGGNALGRAYEQAWLAFRLLGHQYGSSATVAFYQAVRAGSPVDAALRRTTGSGLAALTAQWRAELARLARVGR